MRSDRTTVLARFSRTVHVRCLADPGAPLLVAVSGGADSVSLLYLLLEARGGPGELTVVHLDHGLRGEAARADARWVRGLSRSLGVGFLGGRRDVRGICRREKLSVETAARRARLDFFRDAARKTGVDTVALGHHLDDQAETVLMRLLRGSGPGGLAGMLPRRSMGGLVLIRPLLEFRRDELERFLREKGVSWRTDASNRDRRFLRNRVRLDLLPLLTEGYSPRLPELLGNLARCEAERETFISGLVDGLWERLARSEGGGVGVASSISQ